MTAEPSDPAPGFLRRHRTGAILVTLLLVLVAAVTAYGLYLNSQLDDIARFDSRLNTRQRAPEPTGEAAEARNFLLLGVDKGSGETIEEELADGQWSPGAFRSDTIMLLHVPADREKAFLVSLPRDSLVRVPGYQRQKINAAFSYGGPDLAVRTVEALTGVYVDHVAMIDWAGFKDLTRAIGGVPVTVAETFTDPRNDRTWEAGTHILEGTKALQYVRTRYGLQDGDFDRIRRQQNFLRAVMRKTTSNGTLANPIKLTNLVHAVTAATTVDSGFSTADIRRLALTLRGLGTKDVEFITAPMRGYADIDGVGSVVRLDKRECRALWDSVRNDNVDSYLRRYGGDVLPDSDKIR